MKQLPALFLLLFSLSIHAQTIARNVTMSNQALPLFYRQLEAFDIDRHKDLAPADAAPDYRFAAATNVIPLLIHETPAALRHYPLVFLPGDPGTPPTLAVLVGIGDGNNRFVDGAGKWRAATYIPAWVRRYPFIAVNAEGQGEPVLALDPTPAWLKSPDAAPLLKDGQPTERLQYILAFQKEFQDFALRTQAAAKALHEAGLLDEGRLRFEAPGGKPDDSREATGFLIVSEAKLKALDGAALVRLQQADALGLAYAQLFSLGNLANVMAINP